MPSHTRFDEDVDTYEPSDSEEEYTETEKQLLRKVRNRKKEYSDSEDEVFGVGANDDDKSDLALSDVEGQDDNDSLPDVRAWGKDKSKYYLTDYVDPDYGGFQGKDAHLAELEEEEARNLQKQLAQQLDDDDFSLEVFNKKSDENKIESKENRVETEEIIKTDISKLSKRQKLQILQKDSPEFFGLKEDFEAQMLIAKSELKPIIEKFKKDQIPNCKAIDFVQTQYELILSYCTNIYMYLLLKSSRINVQNHPIIKRLYQYRQLLSHLDPVYKEVIKPQIALILMRVETQEVKEVKLEMKQKLKFLTTLSKKPIKELSEKKKRVSIVEPEQTSKKIKLKENETVNIDALEDEPGIDTSNAALDTSEDEETGQKDEQEHNPENEVNKRAITYEMAKNKGLTPHRKKEQRNPRVKHKLKYRKAIIRRKGAVREPRKELTRYSGEISGIKATVSKSIKIKS